MLFHQVQDSKKRRYKKSITSCLIKTCSLGYYRAGPALEGTACGDGFWCRAGKCVKNVKPAVDGSAEPGVSLPTMHKQIFWKQKVFDQHCGPQIKTTLIQFLLDTYVCCSPPTFLNSFIMNHNLALFLPLHFIWMRVEGCLPGLVSVLKPQPHCLARCITI